MAKQELIQELLRVTEPLTWPRGERLPLYLWPVMDLEPGDDAETEALIRGFDARGIGVISTWDPGDQEDTLARGLRVAAIQKRLGALVGVNATPCTYAYCNGDPRTAHLTQDGEPFFDDSFGKEHRMGCPFALDWRKPAMRKRVEDFVKAYRTAGLPLDFVFADWEIDGPIEWNGAWDASRRCQRCRENIPAIEDFRAFQAALREKRSDLQREMLAEPVKAAYPQALVGNYGVYPHGGYRYWYDYFETFVEGAPHRLDGRARVREWFDEFPLTGYTFAMPVVYPWEDIWRWYDIKNADYRWFYNMLLVGSNGAQHTPPNIPIITFVHWNTVFTRGEPDPQIEGLSQEMYQELLWHLLLRGHDTFFMWCGRNESIEESILVHQVYAAAQEYGDFLSHGQPVSFDVPAKPGPVVSGLRWGDRLLVRRTDFDQRQASVTLAVGDASVSVPRIVGKCQVLELR